MAKNIFRRLVASPEINPVNQKAKSIPILNPFNRYGRVFFFAWASFMSAFLSWFSFPPLLTVTIKDDLKLSQTDIANSNVVALLATLIVCFSAGPLCDRFGPRLVFAGILLAGSVPTVMAGLVTNASGLIAIRFFVGILGGAFVPCQVWTTAFFDKNIIGTANSVAAGWGNSGGGITYFVMPAVFDSLVHHTGLIPHKAWRVAYIVPFIVISVFAMGILFTCDDTPTGKWSERGNFKPESTLENNTQDEVSPCETPSSISVFDEKQVQQNSDVESQSDGNNTYVDITQSEVVVAPTFKEVLHVVTSPATLTLAGLYACTFGTLLSVNNHIGLYYAKNFPELSQTKIGQLAAMFGIMNVVCRPLGGIISDALYRRTQSTWSKKIWLSCLGVSSGSMLLAIGLLNPKEEATMFGLIIGLAIFLEAGNGATFALVPHVFPAANGIVTGTVGATGNLGGIIYSIIFRYNATRYDRSIWIVGVICIVINMAVCWIHPLPKSRK